MRLVRLGFMLGAAVLSAQATLQPLGLAGVQTPPTAPATPPGVSQGQGRQGGNPPGAPRPRREVLLIERGRIVAALPAKAVATPRRPRKLLIFNGSANHPSVPYADLAMQLMGEKTGAFTTTISGDSSVLQADSLKQYDAVYLNNNVGTQVDVFRDTGAASRAPGLRFERRGPCRQSRHQCRVSELERVRRASWRDRRVPPGIGRKGHRSCRGPQSSDHPGIRRQIVPTYRRVLSVPGAIFAREIARPADG